MSNTTGSAKDLDASRKEALQGLFKDDTSSDTKLSTEQLRKLSENISEILGDGADSDPGQGDQANQLLKEDGLPIIDISEPVNEGFQTSSPIPPVTEQEFIPLSLLPPDEKERRRQERDRILDLLEEEERLQQLQEERDAEEERKEAIRKRKESAKVELEQLKATRKLQRKMGQALVRQDRGKEDRKQEEDDRSKSQVASQPPQKSVSFAETLAVEADESDQQASVHQPDWGDVTPGRLRAQNRIPLVSTSEAQKYPVKMHVVERRSIASPISVSRNRVDSDDESPSTGRLSPHSENDSLDEVKSSSSDNNLLDDEPLEEGLDYDTAQHHREIALEYHEKKHAIGAETAKAMAMYTLDEQHESSNGQLPLSHFRADRMAAAYGKAHSPVSTSIGQTVVPAFHQKSLRNSVRLGKLENDRLVGRHSGESGSEDETVREVIQMLQTGSIHNAGPNWEPSLESTIAATPRENPNAVESTPAGASTTAHGAKPSRFRLARGGGITERTTLQGGDNGDNVQSQPTISGVVERKVPRSSPGHRFPINKPSPRSLANVSESAPPTIIDSPSFPLMASATVVAPSSTSTQDSMIPSRVSPRDSITVRPVSKFMAGREKVTD